MNKVRAKKKPWTGIFLKTGILLPRIADSLTGEGYDSVIEIGPGMGSLTGFSLNVILMISG